MCGVQGSYCSHTTARRAQIALKEGVIRSEGCHQRVTYRVKGIIAGKGSYGVKGIIKGCHTEWRVSSLVKGHTK